MTDLKSQMNDRRDSMAEELEARLRVANENVDVLEKMYGEISDKSTKEMILVQKAEASMIKAQYEADYEKLLKQEEDYVGNDKEYQAMQDEYNEMSSILEQIKETAKEKGLSLGKSFLQGLIKKTKEQKKEEYQALGDANFVKPDEPLNQAAVDRITKERGDNLANAVASSFAHIINARAVMQEEDEKADQITDNVAEADYAITRKRLRNEQEIEKLKQMQRKLETTVSDLKMKTANNMFKQGLRQFNPNKDPSELKLDNYHLTKEELQDLGLGN